MQETIRVLQDLLNTGVQPVIHQLTDVLADWYKLAQTTFLQTEILHKDIGIASEEVDAFLVTLKGAQEQYNNSLNEAIDGIKSELDEAQNVRKKSQAAAAIINGSKLNGNNGVDSKQVRKALRSILTTQDEVWGILRENTRLIEQFGQLAVASASLEQQLDVNSLTQ